MAHQNLARPRQARSEDTWRRQPVDENEDILVYHGAGFLVGCCGSEGSQ